MSGRGAWILGVAMLSASSLPVQAQSPCPAGRAWNGGCAHGQLLGEAATTAYLRSLGRLSETSLPVLPREEWLPGHPASTIPRFGMPNRDRVIPPSLAP